jgi:hypothetical protein
LTNVMPFPFRAALISLVLALPAAAAAQDAPRRAVPENLSAPGPAPPAGPPMPPPRSASGRVTLAGSADTGKGIWMPIFPFGGHLAPLQEVPFQPWARTMYEERLAHQLEPHSRCKPSGGVRQIQTPYGVEIVEVPHLQRLYIFDIGGPHSYRTVFMDGRTHPASLEPSAYGHSIGWWEGDTLVVETVGYNEAFWVDRRGLPGTDRLRTLERFTREVFDTIKYEITIDDPGAYTHPFTGRFDLRLDPATELYEYVCQEANYADSMMVGPREGSEATPAIVP